MDNLNDIEKILANAKDDVDGIFDEKARAEYIKAVAKIYEATVKEKELELEKSNRAFDERIKTEELKSEKRKTAAETTAKIFDSILRFIGTAAGVVIPTAVYLKCWGEGMEFERTGIFTSSSFKDLKRSIKLKFW